MEFLPWKIVEKDYEPEKNIYYETNFTLANGYMGLRGCLEEGFNKEMETYPGNYIAGVFDNFEGDYVEIVNCPDFISTNIWIGNSKLDMTQGRLWDYSRTLDMKAGTLTREFTWEDPEGNITHFYFQRFLSMDNVHLNCLRIRLTPVNHQLPMKLETVLDGDVFNRKQRDYPPIKKIIPNYHFNTVKVEGFGKNGAYLESCTKTTGITLAQYVWLSPINNMKVDLELKESKVIQTVIFEGEIEKEVGVDKYVATYTSRDAKTTELKALAGEEIVKAANNQYDILYNSHKLAWEKHWEIADIEIEGDTSSQQGIRFNIFNLIQANASWDAYVNLPAKLLSHTRYKGNAFWDTEMFMFPFYLFTNPQAARNLLMYRYNMLPAARENAKRRGLRGAMYPWMSAHDGSEQCDSWEYGDCEIHITADIAYALDQYVQTTKDIDFLENYATEIYIETARFWVERVAFNERLGKYTILAVKGPDEYCSIANNNMFTNYLAERNLELAIEAVEYLEQNSREKLIELKNKLNLEITEVEQWKKLAIIYIKIGIKAVSF
ncbi:glycoside hydrolase family 65 protein [Paenibacillus sp. N3.4]|nr:glycoside hydrolase family 65 protein [Paenibacillus sp. N3.4]